MSLQPTYLNKENSHQNNAMIVFLYSIITTVVGISLRPMLYRQPMDPGRQRGAALSRPKHRRNNNHKAAKDLWRIILLILTPYRIFKLHQDVAVLKNTLFITPPVS